MTSESALLLCTDIGGFFLLTTTVVNTRKAENNQTLHSKAVVELLETYLIGESTVMCVYWWICLRMSVTQKPNVLKVCEFEPIEGLSNIHHGVVTWALSIQLGTYSQNSHCLQSLHALKMLSWVNANNYFTK